MKFYTLSSLASFSLLDPGTHTAEATCAISLELAQASAEHWSTIPHYGYVLQSGPQTWYMWFRYTSCTSQNLLDAETALTISLEDENENPWVTYSQTDTVTTLSGTNFVFILARGTLQEDVGNNDSGFINYDFTLDFWELNPGSSTFPQVSHANQTFKMFKIIVGCDQISDQNCVWDFQMPILMSTCDMWVNVADTMTLENIEYQRDGTTQTFNRAIPVVDHPGLDNQYASFSNMAEKCLARQNINDPVIVVECQGSLDDAAGVCELDSSPWISVVGQDGDGYNDGTVQVPIAMSCTLGYDVEATVNLTLDCFVKKLWPSAYTPADTYVNAWQNGMQINGITQWTPFFAEMSDWLPNRTFTTLDSYLFYSRKNDGTGSNDGSPKRTTVEVTWPGPPGYESFTRSTDMDNNVIWHASADAQTLTAYFGQDPDSLNQNIPNQYMKDTYNWDTRFDPGVWATFLKSDGSTMTASEVEAGITETWWMIEDNSCADSKTTHVDDFSASASQVSSSDMVHWGANFVGMFTDDNPGLLVNVVEEGFGTAQIVCFIHAWEMQGDFVKRNIMVIEFGSPCSDCIQYHHNSITQLTTPTDITGKVLGDEAEIFLFEELDQLPACDGSSYYYFYYLLECTDGYSPSIKFADEGSGQGIRKIGYCGSSGVEYGIYKDESTCDITFKLQAIDYIDTQTESSLSNYEEENVYLGLADTHYVMKYPQQDIIHVHFTRQVTPTSFNAGEFPLVLVYLDGSDDNPNNVMHIKFSIVENDEYWQGSRVVYSGDCASQYENLMTPNILSNDIVTTFINFVEGTDYDLAQDITINGQSTWDLIFYGVGYDICELDELALDFDSMDDLTFEASTTASNNCIRETYQAYSSSYSIHMSDSENFFKVDKVSRAEQAFHSSVFESTEEDGNYVTTIDPSDMESSFDYKIKYECKIWDIFGNGDWTVPATKTAELSITNQESVCDWDGAVSLSCSDSSGYICSDTCTRCSQICADGNQVLLDDGSVDACYTLEHMPESQTADKYLAKIPDRGTLSLGQIAISNLIWMENYADGVFAIDDSASQCGINNVAYYGYSGYDVGDSSDFYPDSDSGAQGCSGWTEARAGLMMNVRYLLMPVSSVIENLGVLHYCVYDCPVTLTGKTVTLTPMTVQIQVTDYLETVAVDQDLTDPNYEGDTHVCEPADRTVTYEAILKMPGYDEAVVDYVDLLDQELIDAGLLQIITDDETLTSLGFDLQQTTHLQYISIGDFHDTSFDGAVLDFTLNRVASGDIDGDGITTTVSSTATLQVQFYWPPCELTEQEIQTAALGQEFGLILSSYSGETQALSMEAANTLAQDLLLGHENSPYCGILEVSSTVDSNEESFLTIDTELATITLSPQAGEEAGIYQNSYITYSFSRYPDVLFLNVPISAEILVDLCVAESISFSASSITLDYLIGDDAFQYVFPPVVAQPACSVEIIEYSYTVTGGSITSGLQDIMWIDQNSRSLVVRIYDYTFIGQNAKIEVTPVVNWTENSPLVINPLEIKVRISIPSPSFVSTPSGPTLYCDTRDEGWAMNVPQVKLQEQIQATVSLDPDHSFTSRFTLNADQTQVVFKDEAKVKWLTGDDCPVDGKYNVAFILDSQTAGQSESSGLVVVEKKTVSEAGPGAEKYFISIEDEEEQEEIQSENVQDKLYFDESGTKSSIDGKVDIKFAQELLVPEGWEKFGPQRKLQQTQQPIIVRVPALEDIQTKQDVEFTWRISEFQEKFFTIQLLFSFPHLISPGDINVARIYLLSSDTFRSKSDGKRVPLNTEIEIELLPQVNEQEVAVYSVAGDVASRSSIFLLVLVVVQFTVLN